MSASMAHFFFCAPSVGVRYRVSAPNVIDRSRMEGVRSNVEADVAVSRHLVFILP